jgi:hypothetical protein
MRSKSSKLWAVKQQVWQSQREEGTTLPAVNTLRDAKRTARTQKVAQGKPARGKDMDLMGSSRRELRAAKPKTTFDISPGALVRVSREHTYVCKYVVGPDGARRPAYFKAERGTLGTVVGEGSAASCDGYLSVAFPGLGLVDVHPRSLRDVGDTDDEE